MKNIITIVLLFFGLNTYSQQMGFNVVYVKAEENSEDQIGEMFENYYTNNKMKSGGAVLERLRHGKPEGMTHRLVWLWELGNRGMVDGELSEFERSSFRRGISNLVDNWGMSYSGRIVNWYPGDVEKTPFVHIWDIKPEDPVAFQKAHKTFVESLPNAMKDRFNGFGTYDINQPNGATHWVLVSGKDLDDHLVFLNDVETKYSEQAQKFEKDRGEVDIIHDFTFQNLKFIMNE